MKYLLNQNYNIKFIGFYKYIKKMNSYSLHNNLLLNPDLIKITNYNGIELDLSSVSYESNEYKLFKENKIDKINEFLNKYEKSNNNYTSITIIIPSILSEIVAYFTNYNYFNKDNLKDLNVNNFKIYEAYDDLVIINKWICKDNKISKIPYPPCTQLGIGAVIINKNFEFLLIREKRNINKWKFVTGTLDGFPENIYNATFREIKEELGINKDDLEFKGNIYFRWLKLSNRKIKKMDLCFFNLLYLKTNMLISDITKNIDYSELEECQYFNLKEIKSMIGTNKITQNTDAIFKKIINIVDINNKYEDNYNCLNKHVINIADMDNVEYKYDLSFSSLIKF